MWQKRADDPNAKYKIVGGHGGGGGGGGGHGGHGHGHGIFGAIGKLFGKK